MKTLLARLQNSLLQYAQGARKVQAIDYPLVAYRSDAQVGSFAQKSKPSTGSDAAPSRRPPAIAKSKTDATFKPHAYLNKYGQMVKAPAHARDEKRHNRASFNEQALRQLVIHSMVCNGFLSKNYHITLEPEDELHRAYNITIKVPHEFAFTEQKRILVEEIIYATAYEKLTVDVASIVWLMR